MILNNGKLLITPNHAYIGPNIIDLASSIPSGLIAMWSGASSAIPSGWALCDGSNGTPDLRDRFIVGAGSSYSVGNTGGSDSVTLTTAQIPSHTHAHSLTAASAGAHTHSHNFSIQLSNLSCSSAGEHSHSYSQIVTDLGGRSMSGLPGAFSTGWTSSSGAHTHTISGSGSLTGSISSDGSHSHSISGSISSVGSGTAHENRPPYYALCFIMKE